MKRTDEVRVGEFRRLSGAFGRWIDGYDPGAVEGGAWRWVDGIGEEWRRECDGVERRLVDAVRGIEGVSGLFVESGDDDLVKTTVQRVAEGYSKLAGGMLEEVEVMRRMKGEVVGRERRALRQRVESVGVVGGAMFRFGGGDSATFFGFLF